MSQTTCATRYPNVATAQRVTPDDVRKGYVPIHVGLREDLNSPDTLTREVTAAAKRWAVSPLAVQRTFRALAAGRSGRGGRVKVLLTGDPLKARDTLNAAESVLTKLEPLFSDAVPSGIEHTLSSMSESGFILPKVRGHAFLCRAQGGEYEDAFTLIDGCHSGARECFTLNLPPSFDINNETSRNGIVEDMRVDLAYGTVVVNGDTRTGRRINTLIDAGCSALDIRRAAVFNKLRFLPVSALTSAFEVYATSEDDVNITVTGSAALINRYFIVTTVLWNHLKPTFA